MQENSAQGRGLGLIAIFSNHPVAANLLMVMMLLAGLWGLRQLNTQFFPTFEIDYATVRVVWSGASAEDVEDLITTPLEQALRDVDFVKEMTSTSSKPSDSSWTWKPSKAARNWEETPCTVRPSASATGLSLSTSCSRP